MQYAFKVSSAEAGKRLDVFLQQKLKLSRNQIKQLIESGQCTVNQIPVRKPSAKLKPEDEVCLNWVRQESGLKSVQGDVNIIYEHSDFVLVDKPWGISVHPAPSEKNSTLVNLLLHHFPALKNLGGERPGIVHRLDKDTSGLLVVALTTQAQNDLARLFARRQVDKVYWALVCGKPPQPKGKIELSLARDPLIKTKMAVVNKNGRYAKSEYELVWSNGDYSLLKVKIFTGRTHQIRVHLQAIGCPIVGDKTYGGEIRPKNYRDYLLSKLVKRQLLHAASLSFVYKGEKFEFVSGLPWDFKRVLFFLSKETLKLILVGLPGSGKSELAKLLDPDFFHADALVSELYTPGQDGYFLVQRIFGPEVISEQGEIDKNKLLAKLARPELRKEFLRALYPLVWGKWQEYVGQRQGKPWVVGDIPLFLESNWQVREKDVICIGVYRPERTRRKSLQDRGWDQKKIALIESWQFSWAAKLAQSQLIVDNSGSKDELLAKAVTIKRILRRIKRKRVLNKINQIQLRLAGFGLTF